MYSTLSINNVNTFNVIYVTAKAHKIEGDGRVDPDRDGGMTLEYFSITVLRSHWHGTNGGPFAQLWNTNSG